MTSAETARRGRPQAETAGRRPQSRQDHAPGHDSKKALKPAQRRVLVDHLRSGYRVSERRACAVLNERLTDRDVPTTHYTTLIHDTSDVWAQAPLEQMPPGSFDLEVSDGDTSGPVTSASLSAPAFDELLPSWNVTLPTGGTFTLQGRA